MTSMLSEIRVGIIGCGGFAGFHARRWKAQPGARVVALCDPSSQAMESLIVRRLAEQRETLTLFQDPASLLASGLVDAVSILTPHHLHASQARAALEAGCHVLLEKPIATEPADAETLIAVASRSGRRLAVCANPPYSPPVDWVRRALVEERFGKLRAVSVTVTQGWKQLSAGTWRQDLQRSGGGMLIDTGWHTLSGLVWLLGEPVRIVSARVANRATPVDIDTAAVLEYPGGVAATLNICGDCAHFDSRAVFACEKASLACDIGRGRWASCDGADPGGDPLPPPCEEPCPVTAFASALRGGPQPAFTPHHALATIRLIRNILSLAPET